MKKVLSWFIFLVELDKKETRVWSLCCISEDAGLHTPKEGWFFRSLVKTSLVVDRQEVKTTL